MKRAIIILLVFILFYNMSGVAEIGATDSGDAYTRGKAGDTVVCKYAKNREERFTPELFTTAFENWSLVMGSTNRPMPANGCFLLLRLHSQGWHSLKEYQEYFAPAMRLRSISDGTELEAIEIALANNSKTRDIDLLYYNPKFSYSADFELLCDGTLYPLTVSV